MQYRSAVSYSPLLSCCSTGFRLWRWEIALLRSLILTQSLFYLVQWRDLGETCLSAYIFCATKWRSVKRVCGGGESVCERESIHPRGVRVISWGQEDGARDTACSRKGWMDGWMEKRGEEEAQKKRSWVVEGDYKCCQGCAGRRVWHGQRVTGGVFFPTNIWAPQPSKQLMLNMTHLPPFLSPSQPPISGKHHWAETCSFSEPSSVSGSADGLRMNRFTTRRKR